MTNKIKYSWDELYEDTRKIASWVKEVHFKPNYIVGILRGGAIPAVILSHLLDVPVVMVDWSLREGKKKNTSVLDQLAVQADAGKKLLFIEDIVDSGKTMAEIKDRMLDTKSNVLYTSLWYNPSQPTTIHYWAKVIDRSNNESWIVFPYEA